MIESPRPPWAPRLSINRAAGLPAAASAAIASGAYFLPFVMSASSAPSPSHPRIFFWYQRLKKPWFKPQDGAIPVAWVAIESAVAISAYRLLRAEPSPQRRKALGWLGWNVLMIGGWSRFFFKYRSLGISTVAAATMAATGAEFVKQSKRVDAIAARAGILFVAWVSFVTVLTASIWALNQKR